MKLTLGQIADWIYAEGEFDSGKEAVGYSIDSRTIGAGELFFAVKGERVDGHDYVEKAVANGAVAAVVSQRWLAPAAFDECLLLRVPDACDDCVLEAMQQLAHRVRKVWGKRVIGVTGSAGKTTTKECIAAVLSQAHISESRYGAPGSSPELRPGLSPELRPGLSPELRPGLSPVQKVLKTEGNFNNHFGLPLTLLRLEPEHEVAVIEMGMNHAGEIAALAKIAGPNWAVVSNVGMAHTEFFADGMEGIARAKYELVQALPADGLAFLNADDVRVRAFGEGMSARAILYGTSEEAGVRAKNVVERGFHGTDFDLVVEGMSASWPVVLRLPGRHNVLNALAAIAVGLRSGLSQLECIGALEKMRPTDKRGNGIAWHGAEIVNDTYNSNPKALESMIEALLHTEAKRRILIVGEMLELGPGGAALHAACGAATAGLDVVIGVRGLASEIVASAIANGVVAEFVDTPEAAGTWMHKNLRAGDVVLLKASRGVRLERALAMLEEEQPA